MQRELQPATAFEIRGVSHPVRFVRAVPVREGVICDTYVFSEDSSRDLAIVHVEPGKRTPLQRVLGGDETIEGFLGGNGTLIVTRTDGSIESHTFQQGENGETSVGIGETMQWQAGEQSGLVFYEICKPPYLDGRFEDLD